MTPSQMEGALLPRGLFVTGTDTGIGKTWIASSIVRALASSGIRVGAYKPVCSGGVDFGGNVTWEDIDRLQSALGAEYPVDAICPQRFLAALAPPLAARLESRRVDSDLLLAGARWWNGKADMLIVEGAGGLLSPVTETETVADLAQRLEYPLIIVARCGLGTINHTLLTIEAAGRRRLPIAGVILNQPCPEDDVSLAESNAQEIEQRGGVAVLGILPFSSSDSLHRHGCPVTIRWTELAKTGMQALRI